MTAPSPAAAGLPAEDVERVAAVPDPRFRDQLANPVDDLLRRVVQALWDTDRAQTVIADDLGISQKHLSMIRQCRAEPSLPLLRDMCRVLQVEARVQAAEDRHVGIVREATDLCWKATPYTQDEGGFVAAYLLPAGVVHRLLGQLQGAGYPAAFRALAPVPHDADGGERR